jgi:hypothetical protein
MQEEMQTLLYVVKPSEIIKYDNIKSEDNIKSDFQKVGWRTCTGLIWLRTETGGRNSTVLRKKQISWSSGCNRNCLIKQP